VDDHDGTGIPGKDNGTAAGAQPAGQRRPGPKPAVKARKTAARTRKPAQAPAKGGRPTQGVPSGEAAGPEVAAPAAALTEGQADGAEAAAQEAVESEPGQPVVAEVGHGAADAVPADGQAAAESVPAAEVKAVPGRPGVRVRKGAAAKAAPVAGAAAAQGGASGQPAAVDGHAASSEGARAVPGSRPRPAAKGRKTSAVAGTEAARAKPAARGKKAVAAKEAVAAKGAKAIAPPEVTEPQEPGTGVVADQPVSPEGRPWQVPGYLHERDLGADTSGRVVRARHEASDTPVAITYLSAALGEDPLFREAFRSEAELLGGLDSPNVARFHAYVEDGHHAAIVMEPVDGVGLNALLREKGAFDPESALAVFKGSLLGLAAAHEAGVVHRDYKPANVLVTTDGATKLVDFGVTLRSEAGDTPAGTPSYMAPERWAGAPATAASDVYAAAAAFYECLTGTTPYAGTTVEEFAVQHAQAPIPYGPVPEPVRPLIARGLAKEPAERPQTAADFVAELEAVAAAAYGEDWEQRGQRELAALVGQLLLPSDGGAAGTAPQTQAALGQGAAVSSGTDEGAVGVPAGKEPTGGAGSRKPRFGRRARILAVTAAALIVAGTLAVTAVATGNGDETTATVNPTPAVATSLTSAPTPEATSPSAEATTASPTAGPSASRTATTPSPTATPMADISATPTGGPAVISSAVPATASAGPTKTTGSVAGPHVFSVVVTGFACSTGSRTATATVSVRYDGAAAGTLHLTWWRSATGRPQGAVTMAPQTARFPKGATSYTFTDKLSFITDRNHPYVGLTVSTAPAADSGNGSYGVGCH
jgi:serine/threonine-protein kinase